MAEGATEVWSYNSGNDHVTAVGTGYAQTNGSINGQRTGSNYSASGSSTTTVEGGLGCNSAVARQMNRIVPSENCHGWKGNELPFCRHSNRTNSLSPFICGSSTNSSKKGAIN